MMSTIMFTTREETKEERFARLQSEVLANVHKRKKLPGFDYEAHADAIAKKIQETRSVVDVETISLYELVLRRDKSLLERIIAFFRAENKAGRTAKSIKDFFIIFTPYGGHIKTFTDLFEELFLPKPKQTQVDMKIIQWLKNRLREPSTRTALGLIASILVYVGVDVDLIALSEGLDVALQAVAAAITAILLFYEAVRKEIRGPGEEPDIPAP